MSQEQEYSLDAARDYYDIESFLATDQKVPCVFSSDYYDESYVIGLEDNVIPQRTMHELPLWLAWEMGQQGIVEIGQPRIFSPKMLNDIRANALFQSLYDSCPFYYKFGFKLVEIGDLEDLLITLVLCFSQRLTELTLRVFAFPGDRTSDFFQKLEHTERDIYISAGVLIEASERWLKQ